ncbi:MAG: HAMP domain-containing protein [Myxococcota bacterium]
MVCALVLVSGGLLATVIYVQFSMSIGGEAEQVMVRELRRAVTSAAAHLDGDLLERVYRSGATGSAEYASLQQQLRSVQREYELTTDIYTLHLDGEATRFGLTCKDSPLMGGGYILKDEMKPVFDGAPLGQTGVYQDAHGWWLSAYAPIRNSAGRVVALVEADHDLVPYISATRARAMRAALVASLLGLLVAIPLGVYLSRRLVGPLRALTATAERISQGELVDVVVAPGASDEVRSLADSFNRAVVSIRFYSGSYRETESVDDTAAPVSVRSGP